MKKKKKKKITTGTYTQNHWMPGQRENQELQVDIWAQMWTSRISKARERGQAANNRSFFTSRELQELASR